MADERPSEMPVSLDVERTRRFFRSLVDDSFLTLVVTRKGEVRIFSKDIEPDHLARIREVLQEIQNQED